MSFNKNVVAAENEFFQQKNTQVDSEIFTLKFEKLLISEYTFLSIRSVCIHLVIWKIIAISFIYKHANLWKKKNKYIFYLFTYAFNSTKLSQHLNYLLTTSLWRNIQIWLFSDEGSRKTYGNQIFIMFYFMNNTYCLIFNHFLF